MTFQNQVSAQKEDEVRKFPEPLGPKMAIVISGKSYYFAGKAFRIDLQEGTDKPEGDIGLHISVVYLRNGLILNAKIDNKWGKEEVYYPIPQGYGIPPVGYEIKIIARDNHFQIYLNKKEYIFKYRMPKEKLKFLVIGGQWNINSIKFESEII